VSAVAMSFALCGCVDRSNVSADTLGLAVADAGFPCEDVVSSSELDAGSWRVACSGGLAYVATVLAGGDICVEPLPIGDFLLGLGGERARDRAEPNDPNVEPLPLDRCAPDVKVR
jgi:hypothetical protein